MSGGTVLKTPTGTVTFHGPTAERDAASFVAEVEAGEARWAAKARWYRCGGETLQRHRCDPLPLGQLSLFPLEAAS